MKIYFSTSISRMTEQTRENSRRIIDLFQRLGHEVLSDEILEKKATHYSVQNEEQSLAAQKRLTKLKKRADIMVFEVTNQSLGVGQEIALALTMNKPVIALYKEGSEPHILRDEGGDLLILVSYTDETLPEVLQEALDYASSHQDVRFNFFISPTIGQYLDWIAKHKKIPRSVYLRTLIERDMEENDEYQGS